MSRKHPPDSKPRMIALLRKAAECGGVIRAAGHLKERHEHLVEATRQLAEKTHAELMGPGGLPTRTDEVAGSRRRLQSEPGWAHGVIGEHLPPLNAVTYNEACRVAADRAPFPWYGGKNNASQLIWRAFGNVPNYVEPFAGSLAVLLARPSTPKVETVNDKDGLIANFWRSVQHASDEVARWCDWPVNEADLHARHQWLVEQALPLTEKLMADPEYYDAKVAGWWVWGICTWIGGGWCHPDVRTQRRRPSLINVAGHGVHAMRRRQTPLIGSPGNGIHAPSIHELVAELVRVRRIEEYSARSHPVRGVDAERRAADNPLPVATTHAHITKSLGQPQEQIWRKAVTMNALVPMRQWLLPREDEPDVSADVREWALEHGSNPQLRIALCGYEGEHAMPADWPCIAWRSTGAGKNRSKERIWFSPTCLAALNQGDLFTQGAFA